MEVFHSGESHLEPTCPARREVIGCLKRLTKRRITHVVTHRPCWFYMLLQGANLASMGRCRKCGGYQNDSMRLGSGRIGPDCTCPPRVSRSEIRVPRTSPAPKKPSSRLSVAEQLAVLAKLYEKGSLTEQEFKLLKTQLIARGE